MGHSLTVQLTPRLTARRWFSGPRGGVRARKAVALLLVALAVAALVADVLGAGAGTTAVTVAARDLPAGTKLSDGDVTTVELPDAAVPAAARAGADVVGRTTAGPIGAGEAVTATRLVGEELAAKLAGGPGAAIVAITPQDSGLTALLGTGDAVDVITAGPEGARTVAAAARVLGPGDEGVVLLALPPAAAAQVAAANLDAPLTLVLASAGGATHTATTPPPGPPAGGKDPPPDA